jgi:hypothetical protein
MDNVQQKNSQEVQDDRYSYQDEKSELENPPLRKTTATASGKRRGRNTILGSAEQEDR